MGEIVGKPNSLEEAGWGVVFPAEADPALREALRPLLDWRREQATRYSDRRYREFTASDGVRPGESATSWRARHGVGPGPADPDRLPYYLMLAGSPEQISQPFQAMLDVQYAVGRICFDTPEDYARYAEIVVAFEQREQSLPNQAVVFTVTHPDDQPTELMDRFLGQPLASELTGDENGYQIDHISGGEATKAALAGLLAGPDRPRLLFTTGHGLGLPGGSPRQRLLNGALLCADWPGPLAWGRPLPEDVYFSANDVPDGQPPGQISIHLASYSAATPREDHVIQGLFSRQANVAPQGFCASLSQRLLSRGSLAFIGLSNRLWEYLHPDTCDPSFQGAQVYKSLVRSLLRGDRAGNAMEVVNQRYAELATVLSDEIEEVQYGKKADEKWLVSMFAQNNTARDLILLGDPAVRLPSQ